jgi:hypothetical protein
MNDQHEQGIKLVASTNWLEIDPTWTNTFLPSSSEGPGPAWAEYIVQTKLSKSVSDDVRRLFPLLKG